MTSSTATGTGPLDLVVYGDFNCPFSALASARVSALEDEETAAIEWRAVEHDPDIPVGGDACTDQVRAAFESELDQIRALLVDGDPDVPSVPVRRTNTRLATQIYAASPATDRRALRERLFAAYWERGEDLADPKLYERLDVRDEQTANRWRSQWLALTKPIVPVLVLPDGYVSRGLGALARLARLAHRLT